MVKLKWRGEDQNLCVGVIREFDAAHWLNDYKGKCAKLHGHTWRVECRIKGKRLNKQGMVIDFGIVKKELDNVISSFDHNIVNFIVDQPTAENIAKYIYEQMYKWLRNYSVKRTGIPYFLEKIVVYETKDNFFEFVGSTYDYEDWFANAKEKGAKASSEWQKRNWQENREQRIVNIKKSLSNKEYRKRISIRMIHRNPMRDRRNVERMMLSLQKALRMKPNKAEVKLISFFKEKKLDYKYVGNLGFIIDGKNPDFVNVEKKEIIELFGRFWHSNDNDWYNTKNDEEERKVFFEQRGWRVLVVWDNELNDSESLFKRIVEWKKE